MIFQRHVNRCSVSSLASHRLLTQLSWFLKLLHRWGECRLKALSTSKTDKMWPLTGKRTLTTFRETGFSHGYLAGCSQLVKSSEWVAIHNQMGCQKSLTSGRKFYTAWKKFARVGQQLIFVAMISRVNANGFWKSTVVWTKPELKNEKRKTAEKNRDTTTNNKWNGNLSIMVTNNNEI